MAKQYCIIDPIFKGSRLFVTSVLTRALNQRGKVSVLCPKNVSELDFHYQELFRGIPHDLTPSIEFPEDVWFGRVPKQGVCDTINEMRRVSDCSAAYFFTGFNEYFPHLVWVLLFSGIMLRKKPIIAIDYTSNHFLANSQWKGYDSAWKVYLKRFACSALSLVFRNFRLIVLDERFEDPLLAMNTKRWGLRVFRLPDPSPRFTIPAKNKSEDGQETKVLIVGKQNGRKGLSDILPAMEAIAKAPSNKSVKFRLVGQLTTETERYRERLSVLTSSVLSWVDAYVSEEQVLQEYADADYVLLPYTKAFNGSSGVFAYASALRIPLISTDHGCIGYRVKRFGCGQTYRSGNIEALVSILKELPKVNSKAYGEYSVAMQEFHETCKIDTFSLRLSNFLDDLGI